jgi:hypothetical protein
MLAWRTQPLGAVTRFGISYACAAAAVVAPAYMLASAVVGLESPSQFYDWFTALEQSGNWGFWTSTTPLRAAIGAARALVGGQFLFSIDAVRDFVESRLGWQPREELYLVRNMSSGATVLTAALLLVAVLGLVALAGGWIRRPRLDKHGITFAVLSTVWIVTFAPFFAWWEPVNLEFWIALWVPAAILLALPLSVAGPVRWQRLRPGLVAVVLGGLLVANLVGGILPQRSESNDYWRTRVSWYEQNATADDVVVSAGYLWSSYIRYFSAAGTIDVFEFFADQENPNAGVEALQRQLRQASGRVFISSEVFYPEQDEYSCCVRSARDNSMAEVMRQAFLGEAEVIVETPLEQVYQLRVR